MAAARLPNLGEMAIAPLFIGPFAAGLTERDGNFSQICRGETRNKAERNERNILTLVTKCRFAPNREAANGRVSASQSSRHGSASPRYPSAAELLAQAAASDEAADKQNPKTS